MEEAGTPPKLMDERLGHEDGSVQARYSHVTPRMRARLMDALTEQWEEALEVRRAMALGSPVAALDALLGPHRTTGLGRDGYEMRQPRSSAGSVARPPRNSPELLPPEPGFRNLSARRLRRRDPAGTHPDLP